MDSYDLGRFLNACAALLLAVGTAYAILWLTVTAGCWVAVHWARSRRRITKTRF